MSRPTAHLRLCGLRDDCVPSLRFRNWPDSRASRESIKDVLAEPIA